MARALAAAIKSNDFPAVQKLLPDIPVYPALWSDGRWRQRRRGEGGVQMTHVMLAVVHNRPKILRCSSTVPTCCSTRRAGATTRRRSTSRARCRLRRMLLEAANPSATDVLGRTPLLASCLADSPECAELLLAAGADAEQPMTVRNPGATPLYAACAGSVRCAPALRGGGREGRRARRTTRRRCSCAARRPPRGRPAPLVVRRVARSDLPSACRAARRCAMGRFARNPRAQSSCRNCYLASPLAGREARREEWAHRIAQVAPPVRRPAALHIEALTPQRTTALSAAAPRPSSATAAPPPSSPSCRERGGPPHPPRGGAVVAGGPRALGREGARARFRAPQAGVPDRRRPRNRPRLRRRWIAGVLPLAVTHDLDPPPAPAARVVELKRVASSG